MTLFIALIVFVLERFFSPLAHWRAEQRCRRGLARLNDRLSQTLPAPVAAALIVFGLPLLLGLLLYSFPAQGFGLILMGTVSLGLLLLLVAPQQAERRSSELAQACLNADESAADACSIELGLPRARTNDQQLAERIIVLGFAEWFAVLFWFAVGGIVVALLYRLIEWQASNDHPAAAPYRWFKGLFDWLPARLYAALLLLAGGFNRGLDAWLDPAVPEQPLPAANAALIGRVGHAALELTRADDCGDTPSCLIDQARWVKAASAIVLRVVILGLGLIALFTLNGWLR
ncbi:regulatory signaling modulator protein AmpE [Halothiobacillus sp. DCM-1]|uniref:regulatory signaling modulator protein AmpE n=1 Tax=Halothiobacillus sp. DCM-1 TaxID=3112558 RepID=UPI003251BBF4